jgi:hypothetical protein
MRRRDFLKVATVGAAGLMIGSRLSAGAQSGASPIRCRGYDLDVPDDGTDVTQQILDQIASVPDGSTIFVPPKRYRVEGSLRFDLRNGLSFIGESSDTLPGPVFYTTDPPAPEYIKNTRSERRHVRFIDCSDTLVQNLRVESTNLYNPKYDDTTGDYKVEWEAEHGFEIMGGNNFRVEGCSTLGTWGDGLAIVAGRDVNTNIEVVDLHVDHNGRQGLAVGYGDGIVIDNLTVVKSRRAGIDFEPSFSDKYIRNVEVRNSSINSLHPTFAVLGRGDVSDIFIHHNELLGPAVPKLYCAASDGTRRRGWRIEDNEMGMSGSPQPALLFKVVDDISIKRNVVPIRRLLTEGRRKCVGFNDCHGVLELIDNDFSPGGCHVIEENSDPVIKEGNVFVCD